MRWWREIEIPIALHISQHINALILLSKRPVAVSFDLNASLSLFAYFSSHVTSSSTDVTQRRRPRSRHALHIFTLVCLFVCLHFARGCWPVVRFVTLRRCESSDRAGSYPDDRFVYGGNPHRPLPDVSLLRELFVVEVATVSTSYGEANSECRGVVWDTAIKEWTWSSGESIATCCCSITLSAF